MVLNYIETLINDYEMLAIGAASQAERMARYIRDELEPTEYLIDVVTYAEKLHAVRKEEENYRRESLRFQEEADRLKGTNARRTRPSSVSTGLPGERIRFLPDRPHDGSGDTRNLAPGEDHRRTDESTKDEAGVLAHRSEAA